MDKMIIYEVIDLGSNPNKLKTQRCLVNNYKNYLLGSLQVRIFTKSLQ